MMRFLYFWVAMLALLLVVLTFAAVLVTLAAFVGDRTNVGVGIGAIVVIVSALMAWWMASPPPRWFRTVIQKM